MNFAEAILQFLQTLQLAATLPDDVVVMNPFRDAETFAICRQFYQKYYRDENRRWMIIGINPGRFGSGITGIPFTDPIRLQDNCGIKNSWPRKQELSSVFIYQVIEAFGGPECFYSKFYITSVSPLGFTRANKNLNYYDDRLLQESIHDFAAGCLHTQLKFGIHRNTAFCLGDGKNYRYLHRLNQKLQLFTTIIPLSHPRFIMQYRLKQKEAYIDHYLRQLGTCAGFGKATGPDV